MDQKLSCAEHSFELDLIIPILNNYTDDSSSSHSCSVCQPMRVSVCERYVAAVCGSFGSRSPAWPSAGSGATPSGSIRQQLLSQASPCSFWLSRAPCFLHAHGTICSRFNRVFYNDIRCFPSFFFFFCFTNLIF